MKVLIPGAFGYLGGRLAQHLASSGHGVVLGSRREAASPAWLPGARVVRTPWDSPSGLEAVCEGMNAIVHLAGMNSQDCAEDPVGALEFNGVATARLVRAAARRGVGRFIYVSTAHVYGPLEGVVTETRLPAPRNPYATSHRAAEDAVLCAGRNGEIEGVVIRLSNVYGAPAHPGADCWMLLVNDLCRQAAASRRMVLRSSGVQPRDFVPLPDMCRALEHLLHLPLPERSPPLYNVSMGSSIAVWDMARLVRERCAAVLGFRPDLVRPAPAKGETAGTLEYRVDALRATGWEPGSDRTGEIDALLRFCAEHAVRRMP